ncbi:MAG: hypothetical protein AAGF54_06045 [Pseudomonadota bacterium]
MQIPSARNLGRTNVQANIVPVRTPQVNPGRGIKALANGLDQAASDFQEIEEKKRIEAEQAQAYEINKNLIRFRGEEERRLREERDNLSGPGIGFRDNYSNEFKERANKFDQDYLSKAPENVKQHFQKSLFDLNETVETKTDGYERAQKTNYYETETANTLDTLQRSIFDNPDDFDDFVRQGEETIAIADLPQSRKQALLENWREKSALVLWQNKLETNPEEALEAVESDSLNASSLIRQHEGFRTRPYWDVNALRVGYGSDTVTLADGTVKKVTKDTVVTRADAERDLARRVQEFQSQAISDVGQEAWDRLDGNAQAALTSITYNYGEVPARIRSAVKSGDNEAIAKAVESLQNDNDGINRGRRLKEAAVIRGKSGSQFSKTVRDNVSFDEQQHLRRQAQSAVDRRRNEEQAASDAEFKQRYDNLLFGISDGQVDQAGIEQFRDNNPGLTFGQYDKAVTELSQFQKSQEEAQTFQQLLDSGDANVFDSGDRKTANKFFEQVTKNADEDARAQAAEVIAERTGITPAAYLAELRQGLLESDPTPSLQSLQRIVSSNPFGRQGLKALDGSREVLAALDAYEGLLKKGFSANEAAKKVSASRDPELVQQRKQLLQSKDIKDWVKQQVTVSKLGDMFDHDSWVGNNPDVGVNPQQQAEILEEFKEVLEESLVDVGGDPDAALALAETRMSKLYGVSELNLAGSRTLMRLPPERFYPPIDGGHQYIKQQAVEELRKAGLKLESEQVFFEADTVTEQDILDGRLPHYNILFVDDNGMLQRFDDQFFADVKKAEKSNFEQKLRRARDRNERARQQDAERQKIIEKNKARFID